MVKVVRIHKTGDPSVMKIEDVSIDRPASNEVVIRHTAIGLNYIDVYVRSGLYPLDSFPSVIGMEGAGIVEELGESVDDFAEGDRVAYPMSLGAYAEKRTIPASKLVKLPDNIDEQIAASIMLKGLTAHYLIFRTYKVQKGDPILVYAAAGGVGLIMCQWAKILGASVIGCVGSPEKATIAKAHGCEKIILYKEQDIAKKVMEFTDGKGVAVVYDSVGKDTFEASLNSLRPFGTLVTYGNASGPVAPFSPSILGPKGSLYVTRPTLATHIASRDLLLEGTSMLFDIVGAKAIKINYNQKFALTDVKKAHQDLENRLTTGSTILFP
ncbi:MAG: Quinone oxidoreductase 1 [Alphaproteobacteria bacterium MarineAlpha3_Bin5]|nr:MAG: Quinone oxidoreductase 1 [Alphaproteobacteria bacterium MarineAlpha3_Bin5]